MKKPDSKQRLVEVMKRLDPKFTGKRILKESSSDTWTVEHEYELPENNITFTIEGSVYVAGDDDWKVEWYDLKEGSYDEQYIDIIKEWMAGNAQTINDDLMQAAVDKSADYGDYMLGQEDEYHDSRRVSMGEAPVTEKFNKWGQSQDAWASIENSNTQRGKDLQKKANLAKKNPVDSREMGSGSGDSHIPEYYYSYDSDEPISNTNGLTQGQIDRQNQKWRDRMQQDVRRSMSRGDDMYESEEKFVFGKGTKKRLFEVMQRVAPNFGEKPLQEYEGDARTGNFSTYDAGDTPQSYEDDAVAQANAESADQKKYQELKAQMDNEGIANFVANADFDTLFFLFAKYEMPLEDIEANQNEILKGLMQQTKKMKIGDFLGIYNTLRTELGDDSVFKIETLINILKRYGL